MQAGIRRAASLLLAERDRWPLWLPVALAAGVGLYFSLNTEPPVYLGGMALVLGGVGLLLLRGRPWTGVVLGLWIAGAVGFTAAQIRTDYAGTEMLTRRVGPVTVTGVAADLVKRRRGWRLVIDRPVFAGRRVPALRRVRLSLRRDPGQIPAGTHIRIRAVLLPIPPPVAPGAYDFQRQAYFHGIGATGFAIGPVERMAAAAPSWWDGARYAVEHVRSAATRTILERLEGDIGAVAAALLTGKRDRISPETMAAIRDSGLAHLLAISGLHVGLVVGAAFFLIRLLLALWRPVAVRHPIKKWAAAGALLVGFAYVLLAGAPIPTQRAFLMVGIVMIAVMIDRIGISMRLVAAAAAAVLIASPEAILEPGFQMSFAAVIALIAVYESLRDRAASLRRERTWRRRVALWAVGILLTSLVAGLATTPFAIYHFNRFTSYGLAANMLAVPVTAFWVMPWGLISLVAMPFGLEALPFAMMGWGIEAILAVAREVAAWPGSVGLAASPSAWGLVLLAAGGLWLALWRRRWRLAGAPFIAAGMASAFVVSPPDILISPNGRLIAVRTATGGLALSSSRRAGYVAATWLRREGLSDATYWPAAGSSAGRRLACDPDGCAYRRGRHLVAVALSRETAAEDCHRATLVIGLVPVRGACPAPTRIIDADDLREFGSHAIWLERSPARSGAGSSIAQGSRGPPIDAPPIDGRPTRTGVTVQTDRGHRGARPWVALPPVRARRVFVAERRPRPSGKDWARPAR